MSEDSRESLVSLLDTVKPNRRDVLKRLLIGAGVVATFAPASSVLAQDQGSGAGKAKGKGGKGKGGGGKGKGKGKGKGTGGQVPE
jgi:hypothetical protein